MKSGTKKFGTVQPFENLSAGNLSVIFIYLSVHLKLFNTSFIGAVRPQYKVFSFLRAEKNLYTIYTYTKLSLKKQSFLKGLFLFAVIQFRNRHLN